jgi:hypothetical protein
MKSNKLYGIYKNDDDLLPIETIWAASADEAYEIFASGNYDSVGEDWYVQLVSVHKQFMGE